jgi:VacB/RNase II family 3'-5' exoribonuclease
MRGVLRCIRRESPRFDQKNERRPNSPLISSKKTPPCFQFVSTINSHHQLSMANPNDARSLLREIAERAMVSRGFFPRFSPAAVAETNTLPGPAIAPSVRDLRDLPWCSIDNDDSRDLDQLTVAQILPNEATRILVAIADVSALVKRDSAIDQHARMNTTSVYTAAEIFPMLPERLSTDLTSLNFAADRVAIVSDMTFSATGTLLAADVYSATVRNRAKLAYGSVAAWFDGSAPIPPAIAAVAGLDNNLHRQLRVAQQLRVLRHREGALSFETVEARPVFSGSSLQALEAVKPNPAKQLIEDFMIAANGVTARFLVAKKFPSLRRVVRSPARWDRIVELAASYNGKLPSTPDAKALEQFLVSAKTAAPDRFADLSLSVIKLLGAGEYVLETVGGETAGHFGLAVKDYAHSTAPNRRFPDLITQRLLKSAIAGERPPYGDTDLAALAAHCTEQEDDAKKVERQVNKSAAAILLAPRIGERFDAIITGASQKGTWVRLAHPPIEGKLDNAAPTLNVGDRLRVVLVHADVDRGFLDFRPAT